MTDLATIGLGVDSTQVVAGSKALDGLSISAGTATSAAEQLRNAYLATGSEISNYQTKVLQALQTQYGMTEAQAAATAGIKLQTAAIEEHTAATAVNNEVQLKSRSIYEAIAAVREATSGRLERLPGTLSIIAQSQGLLTASTLPLIIAWGAAAAAVGVFAYAMYEGEQQDLKLQQAIISTGNYAGETASNFQISAAKISSSWDIGIGTVKKAMLELVSSGSFSKTTIEAMTNAAVEQSILTGQSVDKIAASYEKAEGNVVKFGVDHAETYHDISLATLQHIKELDDQGNHEAALDLLFGTIAKNNADRTKTLVENYGTLQNAAHDVAVAASGMWDAILGIGRQETAEDKVRNDASRLEELSKELNQHTAGGSIGGYKSMDQFYSVFNKARSDLATDTKTYDTEQAKAASDSKNAQSSDNDIRKWYDNLNNKTSNKKSPEERYDTGTDKINAEADGQIDTANAYLVSDAAGIKATATSKAYADAVGKLQGDLQSDTNQKLIAARAQADLNLEVAKAVDTADKQTAKMRLQVDAQNAANASVASGVHNVAAATEAQAKQAALAPLLAALTEAQGDKAKSAAQAAYDAQGKVIDQAYQSKLLAGLLASNEQQDLANQRTEKEITLLSLSNQQRAVQLAQYDALAKLKAQNIDPNSEQGKRSVALATTGANDNINLQNSAIGNPQTAGAALANQTAANIKFNADRVNRYKAANDQIDALVRAGTLTFAQGENAKTQLTIQQNQERFVYIDKILTNINSLSTSKNKELAAIGKAAAIIQASIDGANAIVKTYSATPYPWNIPLAASEAVLVATQIAKIEGFATGGIIGGTGGPTDDDKLVKVSTGEGIVKASAVSNNPGVVEALNNDRIIQRYAAGGIVGNTYANSNSPQGQGHYFDFRGANFGGASQDQIEARFRKVLYEEAAPRILGAARTQANNDRITQSTRQKTNNR
jgi:uncharacterized membrane protein YjfL (UPF0719 family)